MRYGREYNNVSGREKEVAILHFARTSSRDDVLPESRRRLSLSLSAVSRLHDVLLAFATLPSRAQAIYDLVSAAALV